MSPTVPGKQSSAFIAPAPGQMRACDPRRLARAQQHWRGVIEADSLERFASALVDAEELVQWQAKFSVEPGADGLANAWMTLEYSAQTWIACGLCEEPLALPIAEKRRFSFAVDEDDARRLDELALDHDVLVAEPRFDLLDLIEDELILALPINAQHRACPVSQQGADTAPGLAEEEDPAGGRQTQRPFADLAGQMKAADEPDNESGQDVDAKDVGTQPDSKSNGVS